MIKVFNPPRVQSAISFGAGRFVNSRRIKHDECSFWRRVVEVDIKSENVFYHGSRVRTPNDNARGWMLRDQFGKYRRNLSEMAKSMARHIKNNSPRISLHHVWPILGKFIIRSCLMIGGLQQANAVLARSSSVIAGRNNPNCGGYQHSRRLTHVPLTRLMGPSSCLESASLKSSFVKRPETCHFAVSFNRLLDGEE